MTIRNTGRVILPVALAVLLAVFWYFDLGRFFYA